MNAEDFEKLHNSIRDTIKETVNGKIDRMNDKLDHYIHEDNKWKDSVTPTIDDMKKLQGFASVGGSILKIIVLIGAAGSTVYAFIKFVLSK